MEKNIKIGGKSYLSTDPRLTKDYFTGEYILVEYASKLILSISADNRSGFEDVLKSEFVDGNMIDHYIHNTGQARFLKTRGGSMLCVSDLKVGRGNGKIFKPVDPEDPNTCYLLFDNYTNSRLNVGNKFRSFNNQIKAFTDFDSRLLQDCDKIKLIKRNYEYGVDSATYKIFEGLNYTFGVELETSSGKLTIEEEKPLNLKCEFDGSLRETPDQRREDVLGGEYITGVLKGDSGMFQLQKICNKLAEKCTINNKCGVHVHIGNINLNKENIIYMYKLGELLQNEVYEMLPKSRRDNSYCRKLKDLRLSLDSLNSIKTTLGYKILIDEYYNTIFREVSHSNKVPDQKNNKQTNHPMGSKCGYDKSTQRYCWLNFVTCMFNTKGNPDAMTLEFRSHSATLNYKKVKNWVKICMAFVAFAENNKLSIRRGYWLDKDKNEYDITLSTIVRAIYPKSYKLLTNYIEDRKAKFCLDNGDIEEQEYLTDKEGIKNFSLKEDVLCV